MRLAVEILQKNLPLAAGVIVLFFIAACSDIGDRNNIHDYDGDDYAFGDDLYYLNRDGASFDGEVRVGQVTGTYFVFKGQWRVATDFEKDVYDYKKNEIWSAGKSGQIRKGSITQVYYVYDEEWRRATQLEYDTYDYEKNKPWSAALDGDSKKGAISGGCYVYEKKTWRTGNANDCALNLRGCTLLRQDTVAKSSNEDWYKCDSLTWRKATDIEKDTAAWGKGEFDGEVRAGQISKNIYYIYDKSKKAWRNATTIEKDTFGWQDSTDGMIKDGNVTDSIYVLDKTTWRTADYIEAKFGGCVAAIADSIGKVGGSYYICKSNKWVAASAIEYDTYRWAAGKDGDSKSGDVVKTNCYVYENNVWRSGNKSDCSLGIRGCTALRQDSVKMGTDRIWYKCVFKEWRKATDIEKDTATWGAGKFDGEVRTGQINTTIYYTYETSTKAWRVASIIEEDTYDYANNSDWPNGADGELRKGSVTDRIYVFDKTEWRVADDIEKELGLCRSAIADSAGSVGTNYYMCRDGSWKSISALEYNLGLCNETREGMVEEYNSLYYICKSNQWVIATTLEYDTYRWPAGEDGDSKWGNVNTGYCYVFEDGAWRGGNSFECSLGLRGCTALRQDTEGKGSDGAWYRCDDNIWRRTNTF